MILVGVTVPKYYGGWSILCPKAGGMAMVWIEVKVLAVILT